MRIHENWNVRELRPGDHIRVQHLFFYHHGLYVGDGNVIHFAGPDSATLTDADKVTVRRDTIDHFAMGRNIEVCLYSPISRLQMRPLKKILAYAESRLGSGKYDILANNCEHFVNECLFGKAFSNQIDSIRNSLPDLT
ncbi:MAG: lecithin retinol acyltransferase family protein [Clostridia bacterium]|nr:lecithin retinol acyltransferase family protein [Clostridia bacterium]